MRVFDILLQVFDEGHLSDASGRRVNCKNAIFFMTSNLGADVLYKRIAERRRERANAGISATPSAPKVEPVKVHEATSLAQFRECAQKAGKDALMLVDFYATWCGPCTKV